MRNIIVLFAALLLGFASVSAFAGKYPRETVLKLADLTGSASVVVLQPGLALTAKHAVGGMVLTVDGKVATVVSIPKSGADVAALRVDVQCPCVALAESDARVDEDVVLVGWPVGVANVVTRGISQGLHDVPQWGPNLLLSATIEGGYSGGGVFVKRDGEWQLVGVISAGSESTTLVVPVSIIRKWLEGRE